MASNNRIRRSPEQWQELIDEQARSGLSQADFCEREQLALSTFTNWKRRLSGRIGSTGSDEQASAPSPWIELGAVAGSTPGWDIELDLGDGICLRLRRG
jgi:hypothetical protein